MVGNSFFFSLYFILLNAHTHHLIDKVTRRVFFLSICIFSFIWNVLAGHMNRSFSSNFVAQTRKKIACALIASTRKICLISNAAPAKYLHFNQMCVCVCMWHAIKSSRTRLTLFFLLYRSHTNVLDILWMLHFCVSHKTFLWPVCCSAFIPIDYYPNQILPPSFGQDI